MTVSECYERIGGNYADVVSRLRTDERIKRFLLKVADDASFDELCRAMAAHDTETAFRAAHTLKGICLNLSLNMLYTSASALTEALRGKTEYNAEFEPLLEKVKCDHAVTVGCIRELDQ